MSWIKCFCTRWVANSVILVHIIRETILNLQVIATARWACLHVQADIELNIVSLFRRDFPGAPLIIWVFSWVERARNITWLFPKGDISRTYWKKQNKTKQIIAFYPTLMEFLYEPFNNYSTLSCWLSKRNKGLQRVRNKKNMIWLASSVVLFKIGS